MRWLDPLRRTLISCQSVVWMASWLVPGSRRREWKAQWFNRIWHWTHFLAESGRLDAQNRLILARHCWKAFPEALWLRLDRDEFLGRKDRLFRSPATVLALCFLLLLGVFFGGGFLARSRSLLSTSISHPNRVAVVSFDGKYVRIRSETLLYLFSIWQETPLAKELAVYSWGPGMLAGDTGAVPVIEARVSPEFFHAVGVRPELGKLPSPGRRLECAGCVVLSHDFWKLRYHGDPHIVGQTITVDRQQKTVVGVLPPNFRLLSPSVSVWTSLDDATLRFSNFMNRVGAVALLQDGVAESQLQQDLVDRSENAGYRFIASPMGVASAQFQFRRTLEAYVGFLLLALLCAAGIAWMLPSGSGVGQAPLAPRERLRWWAFFLAKSAALVGVAYLLSWMVVHALSSYMVGSLYPMADEISVWIFLPVAVAVLSWSTLDQQKRCRICLRRLGMPIDIGRPGSVLLNWAGTEMVCSEGHGTLYLPESQANWLERDRWSNLDESWASLFRAG